MKLTIDSKFELNNHLQIPRLGLGVWQIANGQDTIQAVNWALETGYRHIDTAKIYGNEEGVGEAVRNSGLSRDEIWVTTKLFPSDFFNPRKAIKDSLKRLGLQYVDLYLIHWPPPVGQSKLWKIMEEIYKNGQAKAIGVSNFSINQVQKLLDNSSVPPAVNQIKMSPFNFDPEMDQFLRENKIALEAYSPLTRGHKLGDETLLKIAAKYNKSAAQILIRWCLQKGMVVIPKSAHKVRIQENAAVYDFEILDVDISTLDNLSG